MNTTLLNNAYREAYDILVGNSKSFINKIIITENTPLPYDCYSILSVEDRTGRPIIQDSMVGNTGNGWNVENNCFIMPKNSNRGNYPLRITYSTIPATLTAPDKLIEVENPIPVDYDSNKSYSAIYDKDTNKVTITEVGNPVEYLGGELAWDISNQTITWKGMDFYDYISRQDDYGEDIEFTSIQVDSPYMAITYADNKIYIFTGWRGTEWNYDCIYGHETFGNVYALSTDDTTGYGMVIVKDGKNYYAPFVPDTILSYPNNTLFAFLEYRIAYQIASLLNMNVDFLSRELTRAEDNFYKNLGNTNNVHRMNNYNARGFLIT